jgi:hypothetical protein
MVKGFVTMMLVLLSCSSTEGISQSTTDGISGEGWHIKVDRVWIVKGKPGNLYDVKLNYSFARYSTIWVDGLGVIQPSGQIELSTSSDTIVFRAGKATLPLVSVPLTTAIFFQPAEAGVEYPTTITSPTAAWRQYGEAIQVPVAISNFTPAALKALNDQSNGAAELCRPQDGGCLMTPWVPVFSGDRRKGDYGQGDVAVMLVYYQQTVSGSTSINPTIFYAQRQGLAGSPTWDYSGGTDVQRAASKFLTMLIVRISK